jgi:hypothetical protein
MVLESRSRWVEYSKAREEMFTHCDIRRVPWFVIDGDVKKHTRLDVISHLLSTIDYEDLSPTPVELSHREAESGYVSSPCQIGIAFRKFTKTPRCRERGPP